jgi:hypothetical protein
MEKEEDTKSKDVCNTAAVLYNDRSFDEEYCSIRTEVRPTIKKGH